MPLNDELLAHHISTLKHGAAVGNAAKPYVEAMKAIVRKRVAGFDSEKRTSARLQKLVEQLAKELEKPAGEYREELRKALRELARYEATYQAATIGGWVGVDMVAPTVAQVWAAAKFEPVMLGATKSVDFNKLIDNWGAGEVARLTMGVKNGFVQGLPTKEIIKQVVGAGGLADVSLHEAEGVAHDCVMHLASAARFETYKENDDIVIGYGLVNTLDSKTSPICRKWVPTKVYKFTDAYQPKPSFHRWCRTTTVPKLSPEFDIFDKGATRASKDGQVSAETNYYDWLKRQPASVQDEVLGKTKGLIFRNSGISAEEFRKISVDDLGRPLTIEEMAARDKRIASYLQSTK